MTFHSNGFEGQTNGATVTTTNSATSGSAFTSVVANTGTIKYSTLHPASSSTTGLEFIPGTGAAAYTEDAGFNNLGSAVSFYFYYLSTPSASAQIHQARTAAGQSWGITVNTTGKFLLVDSAGATVTGLLSNALVNGTLYRVEAQVLSSAASGTATFQYFLGDSTSPVQSLTATSNGSLATRGGNITTHRLGAVGTAATGWSGVYIDNVQIIDGATAPAAIGPWIANPSAVLTGLSAALVLSVDGTSSSANGGRTIASYDWNWGDATTHGTGSTTTHTYATAGVYTVTLTVTDSGSATASASTSFDVRVASTTPGVQAITVSTSWTNSSLAVMTDNDGSTFATATAPSGLEYDVILYAATAPASGQPFKVFLNVDKTAATSGTVNAQLVENASSVQRSALTGQAIADGSGTVTNVLTLTFPWTDVQNVTSPGWLQLKVKLQFSAS